MNVQWPLCGYFCKLLVLSLMILASCSSTPEEKEIPPVPITAAKAITRDVPYVIKAIGNTMAYHTVEIMPQVSGELTGYYFKDGSRIEKGDLLFTIDARPYEADLGEALGQLAEAEASLDYNEQKVTRYQQLLPDDFVSKLDFEQYVSNASEAAANVERYASAVALASVNLDYCAITAPLSGRLGRHLIDPGNIVYPEEQTPLVVLNQITPIYVLFSIPESWLPKIQKYQTAEGLSVEASVLGDEETIHRGQLTFVNNEVDTATGTIELRATFPNEDEALWPGQFTNLAVILHSIDNAVLIPEQAIGVDTKGNFVFVVKDDMTVEQRRVTTGQRFNEMQVVEKGVSGGEVIVTEGQLSLTSGRKVKIKQ